MPNAAKTHHGMKLENTVLAPCKPRLRKAYALALVLMLAVVACWVSPAQAVEPSSEVWWRVNGTTLELRGSAAAGYSKATFDPKSNLRDPSLVPWLNARGAAGIQHVQVTGELSPYSCSMWFYGLKSLRSVSLAGLDLTEAYDMSSMFEQSGVTSVDLGRMPMPTVVNMGSMFKGCGNLTGVTFASVGAQGHLVDMHQMFSGCSRLSSIDLSGFTTTGVMNMESLFSGCSALSKVGVAKLAGNAVTSTEMMFYGCSSLKEIDLASFATPKLELAGDMFDGCSALAILKIPKLNTRTHTDCFFMFSECSSLVGLTVGPDFSFGSEPSNLALRSDVSWKSGSDGRTYSAATIPAYKSATYYVPGSVAEPKGSVLQDGKRVLRRLYNPNSGEHFYTSDAGEHDALVGFGWTSEGIGWTAPAMSDTPVYRLYNENAGEHHYTASQGERDALVELGWKYEGIGWYSDDARTVPLYRLYNPNEVANNHHYTTSTGERDSLIDLGWTFEGLAWYGVA